MILEPENRVRNPWSFFTNFEVGQNLRLNFLSLSDKYIVKQLHIVVICLCHIRFCVYCLHLIRMRLYIR